MQKHLAVVLGILAVLSRGQAAAQTEVADVEYAYANAQIAIAERDFARAATHLRQVVAAFPDRWEAHRAAAECFMKLDQPQEALIHAGEWRRLRPQDEAAADAVLRARDRAAEIAQRNRTRAHERAAAQRRPSEPRLAEVARARGRVAASPEVVYVLNGTGRPVQAAAQPAVPFEAPVSLLDTMRAQAEAVLRPRMESVAGDARQLALSRASYSEACAGRVTTTVTDGVRDGESIHFTARTHDGRPGTEREVSHGAWTERWQAVETSHNEETVDCRALAASIDVLSARIDDALAGTDPIRARPDVYPGIRDEVYSRLKAELW